MCAFAFTLGNLLTTIPLVSVSSQAERQLENAEWGAVAIVIVGTLCLVWRRRAPLTVLAISAAAFCICMVLGYPPARPIAPMMALYALAVAQSSLVAASAGTVVAISVAIATATHWRDDFDDQVIENLLMLLAACMLGYGIQLSRTRKSVLMAQEARLAREHAAQTEQAVRDEKSRIARELHDVVAHHVSVITAQAAGAQRVFDTDPELARSALRSIETTGRGALTEMRRLLGVLAMETDDPEFAPQPGLDQLPSLIIAMERAGLPVDLSVLGLPRPMSPGVELSTYRIVQEALTNTLKHAGPSRAQVELSYHSARLDLRICDDGCGFRPNAGPGHGLIGMRQRAVLLGGDLRVEPGSTGGVQVTATLPTEAFAR